jgi:hypothetical protein
LRPGRRLAGALLALGLAACHAPTATTPPRPTPIPMPALPAPVIQPALGLSGRLWLDPGFGEIWQVMLPTGTATRIRQTSETLPAQPATPRSGAPLALMAGQKIGDGFTNRFGIEVDGRVILSLTETFSWQDPALADDGQTLFAT